jgi:hypothetical protein
VFIAVNIDKTVNKVENRVVVCRASHISGNKTFYLVLSISGPCSYTRKVVIADKHKVFFDYLRMICVA